MANRSKETVLLIRTGESTFTAIDNITALSIDDKQWDTEEVTALGDGSDLSRHYLSTLYDGGNVTFTLSPFSGGDTQHALIRTRNADGAAIDFQVEYPNTAGDYQFSAFVVSAPFQTDVDGIFKCNVTLKVTGEVTTV